MKKVFVICAAIAAIAAIGGAVYFSGGQLTEEEIKEEYAHGRFAGDIMLNGADIGGMTMDEAKTVADEIEKQLLDDTILSLKIGEESYTLTHEVFDVSFNTDEVLKEAILAGKGGSMRDRHIFKSEGEKSFFIEKEVKGLKDTSVIDEMISKVNSDARDAQMEFSPGSWDPFKYSQGASGVAVDEDALLKEIEDALNKGDIVVDVPYTEVTPKVTVEDIKTTLVRRSYFETSYASPPYNESERVYNIQKCVQIINDAKIVLSPGETMSLNEVLGDRTEAGGWKLAPGYVSGRSEDQAGGGVCQISSTLYCAALKADLTIVKRQNHTIPIGYVNQGLDATISTGGPDLVLRNDTGADVYICCGLSGKQSVYFMIYGKPFEGFDKILITSEKVRDIEPDGDMVYTYTDELAPGEEEVYVKRRSGSEYTAYKSYYSGDELIRRIELPHSTYPAYDGETRVGR